MALRIARGAALQPALDKCARGRESHGVGTKSGSLALALIVALALLLRLAPIDHGAPRSYVPDGHMVRNALGMAQDKDPVPPITKYSTYPYLVPYLLLPVYGAQYAAGRASGAWSSSGEFAMRAKERPLLVVLPARALMALFGALTAWAVYRAARAAGMNKGAFVAAFLTATSLLNVHLSTHERPWAALVFFGALAAWRVIEYTRSGARRELVFAGLAAGASFSCHQAGLAFLALPGIAWLLGPRAWKGDDLRARLVDGLACVALFALVAALVGHPYRLRYGATAAEQIIGGGQSGTLALGAQPLRLGLSLDSAQRLSVSFFGYDPALALLGLAGLVVALRRRELRAIALGALVIGLFALFNPSDHVRYLLPAALLLALGAGALVESLWDNKLLCWGSLALCALALVQAVRFDLVLRGLDTRNEFERTLAELPAGSVIAIDHYGPTPERSRAALERTAKFRELYGREAHRLAYFEASVEPPGGAGLDVIGVEDLFGVDARTLAYGVKDDERVRALGSTPGEVLRALGVTHLVLAERRPGGEARPLRSLVQGLAPLAVLDPSAEKGDPCREALLPTEMDFPLSALWQVSRPGPRIELFALPR